MDNEQIVVTLTTWSVRITNIPVVLDTIFSQTLPPDKVILNLSYEEVIPDDVQEYILKKQIEVFRTEDTIVYKKLIPTLLRYPNACVISIDDDWLYPKEMIEDFMNTHAKYPNNPISGNRVCYKGMICHCGCASLTKAEYFGHYLKQFNSSLYEHCPSDDLAYTYFELLAGHAYVWTSGEYYTNMRSYNAKTSYSDTIDKISDVLSDTYQYLIKHFGKVSFENTISLLVSDQLLVKEINALFQKNIIEERKDQAIISEFNIRSTVSYRIGKFLISPYRFIKHFFSSNKNQ